jgi:hypothetical protein
MTASHIDEHFQKAIQAAAEKSYRFSQDLQ